MHFFSRAPTHTVLLLIGNSYKRWSTWFISLKLCVGFSIFISVSFLLKFIFLLNKNHGLLTLKSRNFFQNENNRKATHSFAPRSLIFKLQQDVWEFNDINVSWSSPKNWPGDERFILLKSKFWVNHFFSMVTFK